MQLNWGRVVSGIESGVIAGVLSESVAEDSDGVPDELASGDFHGSPG